VRKENLLLLSNVIARRQLVVSNRHWVCLQNVRRNIIDRQSMKRNHPNKFIYFLFVFVLTSCDFMNYKNKPADESDANVNEWNEANNPNLKPMYGNIKPTEERHLADKEYVESMLCLKGDKISAARSAARDGWYYFYNNIIDTAMFRFNQSWLIDSTYGASYFGFAAIKEYQGFKNEAEKYFDLAYKHDASDTLAKKYLHQIAEIKEKQNDTLELIKSYYRVLSRFPKDEIATGKLGFFYAAINKPDSALKYYNITIDLDPEYEQTYLNRGWLFCQAGKFNEAIKDYSSVIEKNKASIQAYANRANALIYNKEYRLAIEDVNKCIELDSKYPNFHFTKALCYDELKEDKNACDEIKKGVKKGGQLNDQLKKYKCD